MEVSGEGLCSTTDIQLLELNWTETDWWWPFFPPRNSRVFQQLTTFPSPPHPQGVSTIAPLPQCVLFEAMLTYMITVYHAPVDHDCAGGDTHQLVESSVGVRPSKWDRLVSCYSYHRRYWPGVLWFPLLILLRCTVERGYVRNRGSLLRGSHGQIGQWRSHGGILFGEPKTHEGNTNTQNL